MARKNEGENSIKIQKRHLILCEGRDDFNFLIRYLNSSALEEDPFFSNDIQVLNFDGNEKLSAFLAPLKGIDGYSDVVSLLVIRDAELDAQKAARDVRSAFRANGLEVPTEQGQWTNGVPKTCFLLFPSLSTGNDPGTLEDLCMTILDGSVAETPIEEIDAFVEHLEQDRKQTFSHRHKTRLHTYFSVNNKFVSMKVGEAANAGAFDWSHPNLEPLKKCLSEMKE